MFISHVTVVTTWLLSSSLVAYGFIPTSIMMPNDGSLALPSSSSSALQMSVPNALDTVTTGFASIARLPFGTIVSGEKSSVSNPPKIIALYDTEESKDCRIVRERITELDLVVESLIPSAPNSRVFTDKSYEYCWTKQSEDSSPGMMGGEIPRMVVMDEERGGEQTFCGVDEIMGYFTEVYGPRAPIVDENEEEIKKQVVNALILIGENLPSLLRWNRGKTVSGCATSPNTPRPSKKLVS